MNKAYPVGFSEGLEEYFLRSISGKLRLRGSRVNNHWKSSVHYTALKGVDQSCFDCDDGSHVSDHAIDSMAMDTEERIPVENDPQKLSGFVVDHVAQAKLFKVVALNRCLPKCSDMMSQMVLPLVQFPIHMQTSCLSSKK
jgi:hypothetical protein